MELQYKPDFDQAMARFTRQIEQWGLKMPDVEPLVLDFGLGDFARTGLIEHWIANEMEAGYCGKFLFVFAGQSCPLHHHRQKVETFYIVRGSVRMQHKDAVLDMGPGASLAVRTGEMHGFTGREPCLLLEISKPCLIDDNYFSNTAIPIGGNYRKS